MIIGGYGIALRDRPWNKKVVSGLQDLVKSMPADFDPGLRNQAESLLDAVWQKFVAAGSCDRAFAPPFVQSRQSEPHCASDSLFAGRHVFPHASGSSAVAHTSFGMPTASYTVAPHPPIVNAAARATRAERARDVIVRTRRGARWTRSPPASRSRRC